MSLSPAHKRLHAAVGCLLYDQRYRGRFLTLKTINSLFNKLSPCGKIINRFTCQNAFTIKGGPSYCEYNIYEKLNDVLDCSEGTILAVRRVQRADPTKGYLTAVGCFDCRDVVPTDDTIRQLDRSQSTASARHIASIELPERILTDLKSYATQSGRQYFVDPKDYKSTPAKNAKRQRTPNNARPGTGSSSSSSAKKRGRPGSANQQILQTPRPPTPKTNREIAAELKTLLDVDLKKQHCVLRTPLGLR